MLAHFYAKKHRIYGTRIPSPDGRDSRRYLAHLHKLENEARAAKRVHGAESINDGVRSLCRCRVERKRAKIRRVEYWKTALSNFAALSASLALAEDFKTINGKEYKDATITRVEGDGIVLRTKTGISKVYFVELPQDVQKKFHPSPATPTAAQPEREAIKKAKQDGRRQADRGGRIVVVGQSGVSWKVIVGGIVVLVVVVLAVVRSRF